MLVCCLVLTDLSQQRLTPPLLFLERLLNLGKLTLFQTEGNTLVVFSFSCSSARAGDLPDTL
jgi:hypothetical protein